MVHRSSMLAARKPSSWDSCTACNLYAAHHSTSLLWAGNPGKDQLGPTREVCSKLSSAMLDGMYACLLEPCMYANASGGMPARAALLV